MKYLLTTIKDLIRRGIVRIFPRLNKLVLCSIMFALFCILVGCGTTKPTIQLVHNIQRDTIFLSNIQYDSIFVSNDHSMEYHRDTSKTILVDSPISNLLVDTIYIKDKSIEYKYKLLRDTVYKVKSDSIPVVKEIEVTKEVRYTPWYAKTLAWIGVASILFLILLTLKKIYLK